MRRLTFVVSCVLAVAMIQPATAQAEVPDWARKSATVGHSPDDVVAKAPKGRPLEVVVTRRTNDGPAFDTVTASSRADALKIVKAAQGKDSTIGVEMAQPVRAAMTNDRYRSRQWGFQMLRGETAWGIATGSGVTVAVVDSGVKADHPDLAGRVLRGYDVLAPGTSAADAYGHGTHVAGIIAAVANNGIGIAGLARNARILPVRVLDSNGTGTTGDVATGIRWAADHGADVINLSLESAEPAASMSTAVAYAQGKKVVVVAAAGNGGCSAGVAYPAGDAGVIGVGSIDATKARSSFSPCNSSVDLVAPGGTKALSPTEGQRIWSTYTGPNYVQLRGTSMAAPQVAATAALAIQVLGSRYTLDSLRGLLTSQVTDLGLTGRDDQFGYGLINPMRVLNHVRSKLSFAVQSGSSIAGSPVRVSGRLTHADGAPMPNTTVTLQSTYSGSLHTWNLTTDTAGDFSHSVNLPHNASFKAAYHGSTTTAGISAVRAFTLVRPRWAYTLTSSHVYVTNYTRYGQSLHLQKRSGTTWKNIRSIRVTSAVTRWNPPTGPGTWRLRSDATSKLALRASDPWRN